MQLYYFAWVGQKIGKTAEEITPPESVTTASQLMDFLCEKGGGYQDAFAQRDVIKIAIDHKYVGPNAPLDGAREIAFFPPVTGG